MRRRGTQVIQLGLAATLTTGVAVALVTPGNEPPSTQVSFSPVADAMLDSTNATHAAGETDSLRVDGRPPQVSLLRFHVSGVQDVTGVTLRLWALSRGFGRTKVTRVKQPWDETSTWAGRPALGDAVGTVARHESGRWVTVQLPDATADGGDVQLALTSDASAAERYASREAGPHAPQLVLTGARTGRAAGAPTPSASPPLGGGPVRAAFYYPWFPESWNQQGYRPFTNFHPSAGYYDSADPGLIDRSFDDLRYAGLNTVITSWQGPGTPEDQRLPTLLQHAPAKGLQLAAYYEPEGTSDPSVAVIRADLQALLLKVTAAPAYLRKLGRPVLFVYAGPTDSCDMARRWKQANDLGFYLVLKVFKGYQSCDAQPDAWHQYSPAVRSVTVGTDAVSVSPGFWKKGDKAPRLARDLGAFEAAVAQMASSGAAFQLVTTYNERGEGTSVESAQEWSSGSGHGAYLDVLHQQLASDPVIAAAGDIACDPADKNYRGGLGSKGSCRERATSDLLGQLDPTVVLPLGDIQYECGSTPTFAASYGSTWGRFKSRTRPAIGNHEYGQECGRNDPSPYFDYFGSEAGDRLRGWYSFDVGSWHVVALNSECGYGHGDSAVGGCDAGSPQESWLRQDLADHPASCTLAYWHEPRFSSGQHGDAQQMATIWNDLVAARADVVLSGHNHDYERFDPLGPAPQDPTAAHASTTTGSPSYQQPIPFPLGIREFVVGTGGKNHYGFSTAPLLGEQVRNSDTYGVLALTLHADSYDWRFVPEAGKSFTDSGTGSCH